MGLVESWHCNGTHLPSVLQWLSVMGLLSSQLVACTPQLVSRTKEPRYESPPLAWCRLCDPFLKSSASCSSFLAFFIFRVPPPFR